MSEAYLHRWIDGSAMDRPVGKIVCVGRNYVDHARELGNEAPESPILFMKPATALASLHEPVVIPTGQGPVHHEVEMVVLIGKRIRKETYYQVEVAMDAGGSRRVDVATADTIDTGTRVRVQGNNLVLMR